MRNNRPKSEVLLGDVRDYESIQMLVLRLIFISQQLKNKSLLCEFYPLEAVNQHPWNRKCFKAAIEQSIKKVVFLSTDKAVYPINAMGLSKPLWKN